MKYIYSFILCFAFLAANANSLRLDSLQLVLLEEEEEKQAHLYNQLSYELRVTKFDQSKDYALKALTLAKSFQDIYEEAYAYKNLGIYYLITGNSDSSIHYNNLGIDLAKQNTYKDLLASFYNTQAVIYDNRGNFELAERLYKNSIRINTELGNLEHANRAKLNLGRVYFRSGEQTLALKCYNESLTYSEKINDEHNKAICLNNISVVYKFWGDFELAMEYAQQALAIHSEAKELTYVLLNMQEIASILVDMNDIEEAITYYKEIINLAEELRRDHSVNVAIRELGLLYMYQGEYDQALQQFLYTKNCTENKKSKLSQLRTFLDLAEVYLLQNDLKKAAIELDSASVINKEINYFIEKNRFSLLLAKWYVANYSFDKAISVLKKSEDSLVKAKKLAELKEVYAFLSRIYEKKNNLEQTLLYKNKLLEVKDTLFDMQKIEQSKKLEARYQYEDMAKQIGFLEVETRLHEEKIAYLNYIIVLGILFGIACLLIIILLLFRFRSKKKNQLYLEHKVAERTSELKIASEKAKESDQLKTEFLKNISHEIRTPLNVINGFANLLLEPNMDLREKRELVDVLSQNVNDLTDLMDNIVDISALKTKQVDLNKRSFEFDKFIAPIIKKHSSLCKEKNLEFISEIKLPENTVLKCDSVKLEKVLENLLSNTHKFTHEGHIALKVNLEENELLNICIQDTGIGIPEEKQKFLFKEFVKIEGETKYYQGAGLGLAISKALVDLMGGCIELTSQEGVGSLLCVKVPVELEQTTAMA